MGPERALVAAQHVQIEPAALALRGPGGVELDAKGLLGVQAERAGERAALGLHAARHDQQRPHGRQVEAQVQEVAEVGEAGGANLAGLALAGPRQFQLARDVIEPLAGREGRQGLQWEAQVLDVEGDGQAARGGPLGRQARPPDHRHHLGVQRRDLQAAVQQGAVVPADHHRVGLEPDAMLVGDGQAPHGEVAQDVAAQSFDLKPADPAQHQPADPGLDQQPRAGGQHAQPQGRGDQRQHDQGGQHEGGRPAGGRARPHPMQTASARRGRGDPGLAQKLCPMLT